MSKHHTDYLWQKDKPELVHLAKELIRENVRLYVENEQLRLGEKIANEERSIHDNAYSMACSEVLR